MLSILLHASRDTVANSGAKDIVAIAESCVKIGAIVVAGSWTYLLFVRQRQRYPRAALMQTGVVRDLDDSQRLLTVGIGLTNIGQRLIQVDSLTVVVQQLAPLRTESLRRALASHNPLDATGRREILWYRIGHRRTAFAPHHFEVEPGETERLEFDFAIARSVTSIKVQSHIENVAKRFPVRDWLRRKFSGISIVAVRPSNRCLGWQCTSYYNLPLSALSLVKLPNIPNPEI